MAAGCWLWIAPNHTGVPAVRVRFQKGRAIHGTVLTDLNPGDVIEVTGGKGNYTAGTAVGKGGEISFLVQKGVRLSQGDGFEPDKERGFDPDYERKLWGQGYEAGDIRQIVPQNSRAGSP